MKYFFLVFIINFSFSQTFKIEYEISNYKDIEIKENLNQTQINILKRWQKEIKEVGQKIDITVFSDRNTYYYIIPDFLDTDKTLSNSYKRTLNLGKLGLNENIYFTKDSVFYHFNTDKFITKSDHSLVKWEIHKEKKIINGYECFKATPVTKPDVDLGFQTVLSVWFCPDLNIKGGPTIFGDLPGLIVSLEGKYVTYEVVKITETNSKLMSIEEFKGDKSIFSFEDAEKYHKKAGKMIESNFKK